MKKFFTLVGLFVFSLGLLTESSFAAAKHPYYFKEGACVYANTPEGPKKGKVGYVDEEYRWQKIVRTTTKHNVTLHVVTYEWIGGKKGPMILSDSEQIIQEKVSYRRSPIRVFGHNLARCSGQINEFKVGSLGSGVVVTPTSKAGKRVTGTVRGIFDPIFRNGEGKNGVAVIEIEEDQEPNLYSVESIPTTDQSTQQSESEKEEEEVEQIEMSVKNPTAP